MRFVREESLRASLSLAEERGVFPNYEKSIYRKRSLQLRNATVNTVAPTGTISILAGCSSGIEPLFAISFVRNVLSGTKLFEVNPLFEELAREGGFYNTEILAQIAQSGSVQKVKGVPKEIRRRFVTSFDVTPGQHLRIQAAFQKYTDNSVPKRSIYRPMQRSMMSEDLPPCLPAQVQRHHGLPLWKQGRSGSFLRVQEAGEAPDVGGPVAVDSEYSGGCASGACAF